jgi:hypothetical protein
VLLLQQFEAAPGRVIDSATRSKPLDWRPNLCLESFNAAHTGASWRIVAFEIQDRSDIMER